MSEAVREKVADALQRLTVLRDQARNGTAVSDPNEWEADELDAILSALTPEGGSLPSATDGAVVDGREAYLREKLDVVLRAVEDMAKVGIEVAKAGPNYHTEGRDRARIDFIREVCARWSAAPPAPVESGWRDIATAPRDGTVFIAYSQDASGTTGLNPFVSLCAWHEDAGFCTCELREPTHWMPYALPAQDEVKP